MGQKVNPVSLRIGINKGWLSNWYNKKNYRAWLSEDILIRDAIKKKFYYAGISSIVLERKSDRVHAIIYASRPGIIIGRKGGEIEKLKEYIKKYTNYEFSVDVKQVPMIDLDAQLVAENIALQLEKRVFYRKAMKRAVMLARKNGAKGIKIACSGRLGGAEMRRREWVMEGSVPLHTLIADISYGFAEAMTLAGVIGVKVWICRSGNNKKAANEPYKAKTDRK
ncbi:MAG TPA: 30S ribosomal protein S3 [Deltaproteobacteria bacterium]|nr:30S ribosomal protein S3 [Deltaproteobacteria bacterium]